MGSMAPLSGIPQSAPAFGAAAKASPRFGQATDTVHFGRDDEDGGEPPKEKTGLAKRFSAAMADMLNPKQLITDAIWTTIFAAVIAIPTAFIFTPVIIPCGMAASAGVRGIIAFMNGEPRYGDKGMSMPGFLKRNKNKDAEGDE